MDGVNNRLLVVGNNIGSSNREFRSVGVGNEVFVNGGTCDHVDKDCKVTNETTSIDGLDCEGPTGTAKCQYSSATTHVKLASAAIAAVVSSAFGLHCW